MVEKCEELAARITELFDGYALSDIGMGLSMAAAQFVAKAETKKQGSGEGAIKLLRLTIETMGKVELTKIEMNTEPKSESTMH